MKHVSEPPPDIRKVWPKCPRTLADVIRRAMQKVPADRYRNYDELGEALRHAYDSLGTPELLESPPALDASAGVASAVSPAASQPSSSLAEPAKKMKRRKPIHVWAAASLVMCVVIGSVFYFSRWKKSAQGVGAESIESPPGLPKADRRKPFVNTLGMPFVPVRGAKVLVWMETSAHRSYPGNGSPVASGWLPVVLEADLEDYPGMFLKGTGSFALDS